MTNRALRAYDGDGVGSQAMMTQVALSAVIMASPTEEFAPSVQSSQRTKAKVLSGRKSRVCIRYDGIWAREGSFLPTLDETGVRDPDQGV